ncbi:unnamed protein product, partial [marine sediment metagenome]
MVIALPSMDTLQEKGGLLIEHVKEFVTEKPLATAGIGVAAVGVTALG